MADSLFNNDPDDNADRNALLEKWKAKTPEEVLAAKVESDLYIKTLTSRMDDLTKDHLQLMEESKAKAQLQDLIDRLEKRGEGQDNNSQQNQQRDDNQQPSFKPEDIEAIVNKKLSENDQRKKQDSNFNTIKATLREQLGDNHQEILKQRREELGLTQEFADELARNHPTVFLKTFGLEEQRQDPFRAPPRSNVRPSSFAPKSPVRDWNYYQELKKKDPKIYLDPKIAVQMHEDAIALGDRFGMPED
jgi:hypothetical protein